MNTTRACKQQIDKVDTYTLEGGGGSAERTQKVSDSPLSITDACAEIPESQWVFSHTVGQLVAQ